MFRHLHMPEQLAIEFICTFSRLEYALKSTEFALGNKNKVEAWWDKFANTIHEQFISLNDPELLAATNFILTSPPRKQVLENDSLKFVPQQIDPNQRSTQQLILMVRTVRNNLFHGGKYCPNGEREEGRNEYLVKSSLIVLQACIPLHEGVSTSFES
ncbi:hypothetical protein ACPDLL_003737 [Vibrio cholerae]|uniref:hypothetical protein n=1 Tax=Vibrio metschnikovii TaxID=28172 RepID=UPI002FC8D952